MSVLKAALLLFRAWVVPKSHLALEKLALRQQVAVFRRSAKRPKLRPRDRVFVTWMSIQSIVVKLYRPDGQ